MKGRFLIIQEKDRCLVVNCLDLERYVCSVLRSESWPGWPLEVNKVFAIACRTYVISMVLAAKGAKRSYHVMDTNKHQTYKGAHNLAVYKEAVAQTKGLFLAYDNKPIIAMFDSCCGGIVPAKISGFDFEKAPYLARPYACTFCKLCKIYSWQVTYELEVFQQLLEKVDVDIGLLKDIKITKKDEAGLVHSVLYKGSQGTYSFSGKQFYSLLKPVKSFCYSVHKKGNTITLKGRGFGHHLGLCQWGTREMVRDGWEHKQILEFYYPNTTLMRLT